MRIKSIAAAGLVVCLGLAAHTKINELFERPIPKQDRVAHALNRLTFGPKPGDAERVQGMGLKKWIDAQLHTDRIAENPVLAEKLKSLDSLFMTTDELVANYPEPQMVRQMVNG